MAARPAGAPPRASLGGGFGAEGADDGTGGAPEPIA